MNVINECYKIEIETFRQYIYTEVLSTWQL
jgi:hypothetical protein